MVITSRSIGRKMKLEFLPAEDVVPGYATNIVIQSTGHEFIISFYRATPPVVLGSDDEVQRKFEEIGAVRAHCIAQVIVASGRMGEFIKALQNGYANAQTAEVNLEAVDGQD